MSLLTRDIIWIRYLIMQFNSFVIYSVIKFFELTLCDMMWIICISLCRHMSAKIDFNIKTIWNFVFYYSYFYFLCQYGKFNFNQVSNKIEIINFHENENGFFSEIKLFTMGFLSIYIGLGWTKYLKKEKYLFFSQKRKTNCRTKDIF